MNENEKTTVADRLPELTEDELAQVQTNVAWAAWYGGAEQGRVYHEEPEEQPTTEPGLEVA